MWTWCRIRALRVGCRDVSIRFYNSLPRTISELPRITVPTKIMNKIRQKQTKDAIKAAKEKRQTSGPLMLVGKRPEYNHHYGEKFSEFNVKGLASSGWKHRKSAGDYFSLVPHKRNPALLVEGDNTEFADFGLDPRIVDYLKEQKITTPTNIQRVAIPKIKKGRHVLCAAETGSGKTYAYLLPILEQILLANDEEMQEKPMINAPRCLILVPSTELVNQIMSVAKAISKVVPFSPCALAGGPDVWKKVQAYQNQVMDLVVGTPGFVNKLLSKRRLVTSRLLSVVLDEADTLLDDSFYPLVNDILGNLQVGMNNPVDESTTDGLQVALVSATYPRGLDSTIGKILPVEAFEQVKTGSLHHVMPHVPQKFIRLHTDDKLETAVRLAKRAEKQKSPLMIFCNKMDTVYWLGQAFMELNIHNLCVSGFLNDKERQEKISAFMDGQCNILITTDVASRGLDTQRVKHVLNFDFPLFMSDYIHRAGRVGRVGKNHDGQVTSLVVHKWDVDLLWKIETAARQQKELHNVNANIKRKRTAIIQKKFVDNTAVYGQE